MRCWWTPTQRLASASAVGPAFTFSRRLAGPAPDRPAFAFAGIALPQRFFGDLEKAGWKLTGRRSFGDHHHYSEREIEEVARAAKSSGAEVILTTEKDIVRIGVQPHILAVPLEVVDRTGVRAVARRAPACDPRAGWRVRHQIEHAAVSCIAVIVRALPLPVARRLGEVLGLMFYRVDAVHRRIALANLEVAFPKKSPQECRMVARSMFQHFGRLLFDLLKYSSLSRERQMALVDWEGEERVRLALAQGKGILFCTGHFGFWEQQALAHALKFEPMGVMARPLDNPKLHDFLEAIRTSNGNEVVYRRGAVRKALRLLADGKGVGILIDQHMTSADAIYVDFFGRPAATTSTLAALAIRTGAPVIPLFAFPLAGGRYQDDLRTSGRAAGARFGGRRTGIHAAVH